MIKNRNIIDLLKILNYISNHKHILIMNAKFHSSMMNIEQDMSLTDIVSCPAKVVWPTAFFLNSKPLFIRQLLLAVSQMTWGLTHEVHWKYNIYNEHIHWFYVYYWFLLLQVFENIILGYD